MRLRNCADREHVGGHEVGRNVSGKEGGKVGRVHSGLAHGWVLGRPPRWETCGRVQFRGCRGLPSVKKAVTRGHGRQNPPPCRKGQHRPVWKASACTPGSALSTRNHPFDRELEWVTQGGREAQVKVAQDTGRNKQTRCRPHRAGPVRYHLSVFGAYSTSISHMGTTDLARVQEPLAGVGHGQHAHLFLASRGVHEDRTAVDRRRKKLLLLHLWRERTPRPARKNTKHW